MMRRGRFNPARLLCMGTWSLRNRVGSERNGIAYNWGGGDASQGVLAGRRSHFDLPSLNWKKLLGPGKWAVLSILAAGLIVYEMRTSALQSRLLTLCSNQMTFSVQSGPSDNIVFPQGGPFNQRRGYNRILEFQSCLQKQGFRVREQARFSRELALGARIGLTPPFREPAEAGLLIRSSEGVPLFRAAIPESLFRRYEEIPPLVAEALLFIENRELRGEPADYRANPVLDWSRLAKAAVTYLGTKLGLPVRLQGGSTLATQLEKFRHSPNGRTASVADKLRQMVSASLKVYNKSDDTRAARHQIVLDYLNSVPLGAAPGYGEVNGIGDGLNAWFGMTLDEAREQLGSSEFSRAKPRVFKQVLMLLYAAHAPSYFLMHNREALELKVNSYVRLMARERVLEPGYARAIEKASPAFAFRPPLPQNDLSPWQKAANATRRQLMRVLQVPGLYELDRLHLEVNSTIDADLQNETARLLEKLRDKDFVATHKLREDRLLSEGDPGKVNYSVLLYESRPEGNLLRVQTDSLGEPFDINDGVKLQLGSTAKLRTLAHYLELVSALHDEMSGLGESLLAEREQHAKDPISRWAAQTLVRNPGIGLYQLLQMALDRTYSASPHETFFTGGGIHTFANFDREDNGRVLSVREASIRSVNLVFIRLMRDLVVFHTARLPYNPETVLSETDNPDRKRLLDLIAEEESKRFLVNAYEAYRGLPPDATFARLLGKRAHSLRHLAILGVAFNPKARLDPERALTEWFGTLGERISPADVRKLAKAYGNARLNLADYAYLLGVHPLELWCLGELRRDPAISRTDMWNRSAEARRVASAWLFKSRNRRAQDLRLRIRFESDAFARMTPSWQRLGFPFDRLVPSLATAIGSSSDRPAALAELMGIVVNNGVRRPTHRLKDLAFAAGTPYHTVLEIAPATAEKVMNLVVSKVLREILAEVVNRGTARRVSGAFVGPQELPVPVGGKTGSGDNRFIVFGQHGTRISAHPVNRTATFVFFIGDRYFGVITAYVEGSQSDRYGFTSALPVSVLRLLAPMINSRLSRPESDLAGPTLSELNGSIRGRQAPLDAPRLGVH